MDQHDAWWIDGHLDLAYIALEGKDILADDPRPEDEYCVSLPTLRRGGIRLAFTTIFTEPGDGGPAGYPSSDDREAAFEAGRRQLEVYERLEIDGRFSFVRSAKDLDAMSTEWLNGVLLMEGADPIRNPAEVAWWVDRGLRMVGLTWSSGTRYAGGNACENGLSVEGRDLVRALDEHGVIHDISHLSDRSFDDLFEVARGPIVATHSNARALLDGKSQRHLRDEQIRAIAERGGVIGLNLYGGFLNESNTDATLDDCLRHVEHVADVAGGRQFCVLGSDLDGGFGPKYLPRELDHPTKLHALADGLASRGWSDADVAGFMHGNWLRILRNAWRDAS